MMKRITYTTRFLLLIFISISAFSCREREKSLTIISTNDIHAQIDNFPRLATLVEQERKKNPGRVLLIDAGDRWTGSPYVDRNNHPGKPIIELMNKLGYDFATYGNHEFDWGTDTLGRRMSEADFELLLANADFNETKMPTPAPYKFVDIDGLRIAILGLITVEPGIGHPVGKDASYYPATFTYPLDEATKYSWLKDSSDLYIGLTHIGFEEDSLLALQQGEIDLIIGGHSHTLVPVGRKINNTIVTQTERNLKYAGVTRINYKGKEIMSIDNKVVKLDTIAGHPDYQTMVDNYYNAPELTQEVGRTTAPMDKIALMNLFTDAMRKETFSQFTFNNMGGMRIDMLPAGKISRADIFSAEPFGNSPAIVYMTIEQIKQLIINKFNSTGKESHTLDIYPSGMSYEIITKNGEAVDVMIKHEQRPSLGNSFRVSMSDYMKEQYDYEDSGIGKYDGYPITGLMFQYLKENSPITPDPKNRVTIR